MSFRDLDVDLENQTPFSDSPEFDQLREQSSDLLLDANNNLVTLRKLIKALNDKKSSEASKKVSNKALKSIEIITDLFKNISVVSRRIAAFDDLNPAQIFTKDKINSEIKQSLEEFQTLQLEFTEITNKLNEESKAALDQDWENGTKANILVQPQQQELTLAHDVINDEEFTYQQSLIREREDEIRNIEQGIEELNEIFSDLGTIVQEQGTMVDNIESNMYDVAQSTKVASNELSRALSYQRSSRRKTMCLFLFFAVILLIVLLGIFL